AARAPRRGRARRHGGPPRACGRDDHALEPRPLPGRLLRTRDLGSADRDGGNGPRAREAGRRARMDRRARPDAGACRHRPPRRRRWGRWAPTRCVRAPARIPARRFDMTIAPVPVSEAKPGLRPAGIDDPTLFDLYRAMIRVRAFEDEVVSVFEAGL